MPDAPAPPSPSRPSPQAGRRSLRKIGLAALGLIAVFGAGAAWMVTGGVAAGPADAAGASVGSEESGASAAQVDVVRPARSTLQRKTTQPCSVHAFESVDLFARASGYLKSQSVDIGSHVKKGDLLAEIDLPVEQQEVAEAEAVLDQSRAQAKQAAAMVETAKADLASAVAMVDQDRAEADKAVATKALAEKQLDRVKALFANRAVDKRLVDEHQHDYDAAQAGDRAARAAIVTAQARLQAAKAKVRQAEADQAEAEAAVHVAESRLERARAVLAFAKIVAPFDGVVTRRSFHPGAFIRSASEGQQPPLFTVVRIDLMRVIVQVPDPDVVLATPGDPATVTIDELGGRAFTGTVARVAEAEDSATRTMRLEIDLPNPDDLLRAGMYGRATIVLQPPSQNLAIPSSCVVAHEASRQGAVFVVDQGQARRRRVRLGDDNGVLVEVLDGLSAGDAVVSHASSPLEDGMSVAASQAPASPAAGH